MTMANPPKSLTIRKRHRVIEELMLNGYRTREIFDIVGESYGISYGTLRNDVYAINKAHRADLGQLGEQTGREKYLASIRQIRRMTLRGWDEQDAQGVIRIRGRDFKLAHQLDKEIAGLSGVVLTTNDRTLHLNMEKARGYLELIFQVVFKHVPDQDIQKLILDDLEQIDATGE